jgi:hypothetical protein
MTTTSISRIIVTELDLKNLNLRYIYSSSKILSAIDNTRVLEFRHCNFTLHFTSQYIALYIEIYITFYVFV